jgi:hypothetical protein
MFFSFLPSFFFLWRLEHHFSLNLQHLEGYVRVLNDLGLPVQF